MNDHAPTASHLLKRAENFLKSLKPGPLAIAVSGGSDSLGVLLTIHEVNYSDRKVLCFTVDHGLRAEAAAEAKFVSDVCASLGITHQILNWVDEKPLSGIQNAARQARYRLLADACAKENAVGLVTGHTLDDQFETVAMRADRNASVGARGLSGMATATLFFNQMWVLRPFLGSTKIEFQKFLNKKNQTWIEDPSNQDDKFERVRVRKQANFPFSLPEIMDAQELRLKTGRAAAEYLTNHCAVLDGLFVEVNLKLDDPSALLRAVESLIDVIGGRDRALSGDQMERLWQFIKSEKPKPMTLGRTLIVKKSDELILQRENRNLAPLEIGPHSTGVWDGRFSIENRHPDNSLLVRSNVKVGGFPPKFSWKTNSNGEQGLLDEDNRHIFVIRYINRFDEVLSMFDIPLALAVSKLFEFHQLKPIPFVDDL